MWEMPVGEQVRVGEGGSWAAGTGGCPVGAQMLDQPLGKVPAR